MTQNEADMISSVTNRCNKCQEYDHKEDVGQGTWLFCRMSGFLRSYKIDDVRTLEAVASCKFYKPKPAAKTGQTLLFDSEELTA